MNKRNERNYTPLTTSIDKKIIFTLRSQHSSFDGAQNLELRGNSGDSLANLQQVGPNSFIGTFSRQLFSYPGNVGASVSDSFGGGDQFALRT